MEKNLYTFGKPRWKTQMDPWLTDILFERQGVLSRVVKAAVVNPLANYLPASLLRALLRMGGSELAKANWADPGGWRSMVISYDGQSKQIADKLLINGGTIPMALRNRRRLGARILAKLIDSIDRDPVEVLCLGAGPGRIIIDAMKQAKHYCQATLVDLNNDAFEYGRKLAEEAGLTDRLRYVQGDIRDDLDQMLCQPPDIVKMLGICEYLTDQQIMEISRRTARLMPAGAPIVFNSLSKRHGTDRFFRRVFRLHMHHRSPQQLQQLMAVTGFERFQAVEEPLGVYHVIVGYRKDI